MFCLAMSQGKNSSNSHQIFADVDAMASGEEVSDLLQRVLGVVRPLIAVAFARAWCLQEVVVCRTALARMRMPVFSGK